MPSYINNTLSTSRSESTLNTYDQSTISSSSSLSKTTTSPTTLGNNSTYSTSNTSNINTSNNDNIKSSIDERTWSILRRQSRANIERIRTENSAIKHQLIRGDEEAYTNQVSNNYHINNNENEIKKWDDEYNKYLKKIKNEEDLIELLKNEINDIENKIENEQQIKGILAINIQNQEMIGRHIKLLDTRLEKASMKYNASLAKNKKLRETIDSLREKRRVFDGIYKTIEKELYEKKIENQKVIEKHRNAYLSREKSQKEMDSLRGRAEEDRELFDNERIKLCTLLEEDEILLNEYEKYKESNIDNNNNNNKEFSKRNTPNNNNINDNNNNSATLGKLSGNNDTNNLNNLENNTIKNRSRSIISREKAIDDLHEKQYEILFNETGFYTTKECELEYKRKEETIFSAYNHLIQLTEENDQLIQSINELDINIKTQKEVESLKDSEGKQKLREIEESLSKTKNKSDDLDKKYRNSFRTLTLLKRGVQTLYHLLSSGSSTISANEEMLRNQGVQESNILQFLGLLEQKTSNILQKIARLQISDNSTISSSNIQNITNNDIINPNLLNTQTNNMKNDGRTIMSRILIRAPASNEINHKEDEDEEERPLTLKQVRQTAKFALQQKDSRQFSLAT